MLSDRATILSHTTLTALIIISTIILPITCKNATSISPTPRTSFETPRPSSATQQTSSSTSGSSSSTPTNTSKTVYSTYSCRIKPEDRQVVKYLQDSLVYIFEVSIYNESQDPLRTDVSETYKPWKWYRTNSEHGKTLLALSFNYDVLSLNILTIGVEHVYLKLKDSPQGCFKKLTAEQRVEILRAKVFDNFKRPKKIQTDENGVGIEDESSVMFVCNEIVRQNNGFGEFANRCCRRDANGEITCSEKEDNVYITVLYVCIGLVKLTMFMFCPLLIPAQMYTAAYLASEYVVNLTQELKLKIFVSESPTTSVRYKNRLTLNEISDWKRLRESLEDIPMDEICHVKVPELRIKVQGKRIIPANEPPTGLLRSLYDNLIRCKLRGIEPFKECCDMSVFGSLEPHIKYKCTWDQVVIQFMKFVTLMLTPLPFYIRVFVYYRFEEQELNARKKMLANFDLEQDFNPFRMNMIQYYSPTHPLFYTTYAFYIISGIIIGFSGKWIREKLKSITKSSFHDMQSVSRTNVLQIVIGILIWPFKKIGLIALVACPVYTIITLPFWCVIFLLYGIPTFYLGYRLVFHSIKQLGGDVGISIFESDKPMSNMKQKAYKVKKRIAKIDRGVHINRSIITDEDKHSPCLAGFGRLFACRRLFLQVTVSVFCLIVLFSSVLMFVEAIGIIVEVLVFTMMGIIVNAGSTLRYVSMALLVIVYMHNCYNSVYENYLEFNGTVLNDIMDRVEDLKKIASLPSSMQENAAFQAIGIIVEVLVFTMMGIIVNAGSTLRYVSMALLVIVYMHNCYNSVYENYLEFNGTVLNDIMDRVEERTEENRQLTFKYAGKRRVSEVVEVLVFTMMGIIVNAGSTLRYVSMALLVIVYMHNCYNSVYENYLEFNGTVLNDIMDRVEDLKKIASLPSSMQENAAFQVKCVEAVDEIQTTLNLEKEMPQWRIGHLLLFLDSFDTPRIPLNLFKKLCEVRIHGAPGPVYINLLKATAKFSVIVVFLFFVMIVVMAFGSNQQMSSTNQTLATLAGGFVPMLLKNVLSSKSTKLNLKTLSFKGQVDEIIAEYKQNWPINDFTLTKYDPIAEAEAEAEKEKEKENEGKDAKEGKVKDENESGEKDKTDKETVNEKQATEDTEKEKETIKVNGGPSNGIGTTSNSLQPPALFRDSLEDLAIETLGKSPRWLSRLSIMPTEDNFVDLFIDLSATAEEPAWTWYDDEADSLQSITMLNNYEMQSRDPRMPYYQPTVIQIDGNDAMDGYPLTSPPDYNSVVMKRQ